MVELWLDGGAMARWWSFGLSSRLLPEGGGLRLKLLLEGGGGVRETVTRG